MAGNEPIQPLAFSRGCFLALELGRSSIFDLHGARVIVAGGSSRIGLATARLVIDCGASVIIIECDGGLRLVGQNL